MAKQRSQASQRKGFQDFQGENARLRKKLKELEELQKLREERREKDFQIRLSTLLDCMKNPVFIFDATTYRFLYSNEAAQKIYGYSKEEIFALTPFDLHKAEDFERVRAYIDKESTDDPAPYNHFTKDRRERIVEIQTTEIHFQGNPCWMSVIHDMTDRILMEEELFKHQHQLEKIVAERTKEVLIANKKLRQEIQERHRANELIMASEKKLRDIIENTLDGIVLVDEKGSVIEWNQGQEKIYATKRGMVIGRKVWDVYFQHVPQQYRCKEKRPV